MVTIYGPASTLVPTVNTSLFSTAGLSVNTPLYSSAGCPSLVAPTVGEAVVVGGPEVQAGGPGVKAGDVDDGVSSTLWVARCLFVSFLPVVD